MCVKAGIAGKACNNFSVRICALACDTGVQTRQSAFKFKSVHILMDKYHRNTHLNECSFVLQGQWLHYVVDNSPARQTYL